VTLRPWQIDVAVALAIAALLWILAPGLAIVALVAVVVLVVCGVSLGVGRLAKRRAR
jgi:hypothetical protein